MSCLACSELDYGPCTCEHECGHMNCTGDMHAKTALDAIEQEALRELERRELPATALGPYAGQRAQSCEPGGHRSARDKVCRCCYGRGGGCSCGDKCKPCDGTGVVYE